MAANTKNETQKTDSPGTADGKENIVSMLDVLEEENQLGKKMQKQCWGSDDKNCTYLQVHCPIHANLSDNENTRNLFFFSGILLPGNIPKWVKLTSIQL